MINRIITMREDISKVNDISQIGNAVCKVGCMASDAGQCFSDNLKLAFYSGSDDNIRRVCFKGISANESLYIFCR